MKTNLWCTFTWDKEHIPADEAAADRDIANFIRKINYRQEKGRPGKYQVSNHSSGRRSRTPTRPHYHDRAGDKPGRIRKIVDKRGKIQHTPHKARQRFSSFRRCHVHDEQPEGKRKWRGSKNLVKPKEPTRSYSKFKKRTVERMAHDYETLKAEMEKAYPGYKFLDAEVKYNGVTAAFYIYARMVRN